MEYKHYWCNVVMRYHVIIEGWPESIPFCNLSDTLSPLDSLEKLLWRWQNGRTFWKKLTDDEFRKIEREHTTQGENDGLDACAPRRCRSDYGRKRTRTKEGPESRRKRQKSKHMVHEDDESEDSDGAKSTPTQPIANVSASPTTSPTTHAIAPALPASEAHSPSPVEPPNPIVTAAPAQTPVVPAPVCTGLATTAPVVVEGPAATVGGPSTSQVQGSENTGSV
jgi:hypothetical protein